MNAAVQRLAVVEPSRAELIRRRAAELAALQGEELADLAATAEALAARMEAIAEDRSFQPGAREDCRHTAEHLRAFVMRRRK